MYSRLINIKGPTSEGYLYFIDNKHPLAVGNSGKVYLHRHLASIYQGYWLTEDEHVHHIDGIKSNNVEDNLLVLTSSEHTLLHKGMLIPKNCKYCNNIFIPTDSNTQIYCTVICANNSLIKRPDITKEQLDLLIPTHTWVSLGRIFGYSDAGIKKRAKALGCNIPVRKRSSEVEQCPYKAQVEIA